MDRVRNALNDRGLTLDQARMTVHDRVEWICEQDVREDWHRT